MQKLLSLLSYVGMALVFGALATRILKPEWDQYAVYASWTGLALVVLYTIGQWREIAAFFRSRNARYGTLASFSVLIVLGILVAVNYLSAKENKRWDLTANRQYSLSDQSIKLLKGLNAPVKFLVFDEALGFDRFRPRLDAYEYQSGQVSVEYIDGDKEPIRAREYEVQAPGTIVVEYMGRRERITSDNEQDLTNALIKVLNPVEKRVYFLAGHGEKDPASSDERRGYSGILGPLKRDNYQWEKLVLAQTNAVPANATVIVIAGPKTDLVEGEDRLLRDYLAKSGKLLVLLDPPDDIKNPALLPRLEALLKEWGVNATATVIVDVSGLTEVPTQAVAAPPYPGHPITENFTLLTLFPLARAVLPASGAPPDRPARPIVETTSRAWAEVDLSALAASGQVKQEPEKGDIPGPVTLAVAVAVPAKADTPAEPKPGEEQKTPETRLAVFGDSDFASNGFLGAPGNGNLFMNTLNWLAQQEGLIAIRAKEPSDRRLTMTANHITGLFWLSIVLVPAAVLGTGVYTWWRRR